MDPWESSKSVSSVDKKSIMLSRSIWIQSIFLSSEVVAHFEIDFLSSEGDKNENRSNFNRL